MNYLQYAYQMGIYMDGSVVIDVLPLTGPPPATPTGPAGAFLAAGRGRFGPPAAPAAVLPSAAPPPRPAPPVTAP